LAQTETPVVKKGNASWKPHRTLALRNQDPTKRYRWVNRDDMNLDRKTAEGWSFEEKPDVLHLRPKTVEAGSGKVAGSRTEYRDLVLMSMPEDVALGRQAYFAEQTAEQTKGLRLDLDKKLRGIGAPGTTGDVKID
jgi:hypothetical protein